MTTISVLLHENDERFFTTPYLARLLVREWRHLGFAVEVRRGTEKAGLADLLVPHLDMTVTPDQYRDFIDRHPQALNRGVFDVSKSRISRNLRTRGDRYAGPVIVKTDRNFGGIPEVLLGRRRGRRGLLPRLAAAIVPRLPRRLGRRIGWRHVAYLPPDRYPVFSSLPDVPAAVFDNPHLVVEKFLPESHRGGYCVRYHYFLGDREVNLLVGSASPLVKAEAATYVEEIASVPPELRALRRALAMDYGKFDYVVRDERVVLFDVNRTPAAALLEKFALSDAAVRELAPGILSLRARPSGAG
ncbi:MAG: hypothetical protein B6D46_12985 [Polyangiaceae bacterium UTPRO1]|jgi:hypothetical protein|nr:hypothetical protein [Myxococcales bacterium]OQY65611.1 MAG: hypothetical protein B6D46_12985 [Polyangiaceae bacterium UTPRO1]